MAAARAVPPGGANDLLLPYVPRLVVDWLHGRPEVPYRSIDGTGVFADISGFTNLTEKLARRGKAGAEEMGDVLNAMFEELLSAAYQYGAGLIKWGGDAVLLLFDQPQHAQAACRAAYEMQRVMTRIGRISTSAGVVKLRMSIGIHSGPLDFLLVGARFRELIVTGPGATTIAQMEKVADAGEIVISAATAAALAPHGSFVGAAKGEGRLLAGAPDVARSPALAPSPYQVDLSVAVCDPIREHLLGGAVEAEHRNVTVSFIECEGTDELLAAEGPDVLSKAVTEFISNCQHAAAAHDVTFLSSDIIENGLKVILLAGAPKSSGDNEARVLTATRQVIDDAGILALKAGVNCGRVFAGDYGTSYRRVYSVTGDSVNLAARLMAKAEHGQIVVAPAVLKASRTIFYTDALEPFAVKGKSEPIEAVLLGPIVDSGHSALSTLPLIGRDHELAVLLEAAAHAWQGGGRVVELVGPPGIGKSRLLSELIERTTARLFWADGDIYGSSTPYQPFQRLFRQQLGLSLDAEPAVVATALVELVTTVTPHLLPWMPLIGIVAGVDLPVTDEIAVMDPEGRKERLEAVTSESLGLLLDSPTTLIFNDVHFMDEATVDLIHRLAADAADRPWLVVTTRRPDSHGEMTAASHAECIDLGPLSDAATDALLAAATVQAPLPAHRMSELTTRAGGNPLFVVELAAGAHDLTAGSQLPDSIEGVIATRIDRLDPEQRRVLRAASVLGMTIDLDLLGSVLRIEAKPGQPDYDAWDALAEFLTPAGENHLHFAHHLTRETAYEGLAFRRRAVLHARTADLIETQAGDRVKEHAALLSLHCLHGERYQAAWEYSRQAADSARAVYANADAAELYRRALDAAQHLPGVNNDEFIATCEALGAVYDDLGEFVPAETVIARARRRVSTDSIRAARLSLQTATIRQRTGNYSVALRWLSTALAAIAERESHEASALRATLMTRYAWIRSFQGKSRDSIRWAELGIAEAERCGERSARAHCLEVIEWGRIFLGDIPDESPAAEALVIYEELGDIAGQASIYNTLGAREYFRGHWDEAVAHYQAAEKAYRACGATWGVVMPMASRAEILSDQGRLHDAEALAHEALRLARGANNESDAAFARSLLGRVCARTERFDEAMDFYGASREFYASSGVASLVVQIEGFVAECHLLRGDIEAALTLATAAIDRGRRLDGMEAILPLIERVRAVSLARTGNVARGRSELAHCLSKARDRRALPDMAFVLRELLGLPDDQLCDDRESWQRELAGLGELLGLVEPAAIRT